MRTARLLGLATDDPDAQRVVGALIVAVFVQGVGASAVLPLLPLFLRGHGTSTGLVGAVMGSFFVAGVLTQYPAGHLADRFGHRPVIVGGLLCYAAASLGYLMSVSPGGYVVLRSLQGVGSGAVQVASLALVGVVVPVERRGRAFSAVFGAQLAGMAIGPLAGSVTGVAHLRWLFAATACASVAAIVPVLVGTRRTAGIVHVVEKPPPLTITAALVGVALVGVSGGLVAGVYETCWSLLMSSRGAHAWQIGLSWTLFALPFAAFSPTAGRLADRLDRRHLAIGALLASSAFAAIYPFLPSVAWLMGLGVLEAVAVAVALPAAQSMLTQTVRPEALGRAQGLFTTAETAAIAVAATTSGVLFAQARWLPFVAAAATGAAIVGVLPALWRGMPGHAGAGAKQHSPSAADVIAVGSAAPGPGG